MSEKPEVLTTEVEASEQTVAAVRNEIPVGVSGAPIDRLPLSVQLQQMANAGTYTKRIASTDRCIRVVDVPVRGGGTAQFHCSRACVRVGDMQLCPDHDKAAFQPSQTPVRPGRVINSASIPLSAGEVAELTKISKSFANPVAAPPPTVSAPVVAVPAAPVTRADNKVVTLHINVDDLERESARLPETLARALCDALDNLPAGTMREMKQVMALQARINKVFLKRGGKRHVRTSEDRSEG